MVPKVKCPKCGNVSPVPERLVGKKVRCIKCDTQFAATPLESGQGIAEVVAPPIEVVAHRVAGGGAQGSVLWLVVGILALLLPVAGATVFAALAWHRVPVAPPGEPYGVIEIASKGVKYVYFEIYPRTDAGTDLSVLDNNSTSANLVENMAKTSTFHPEGRKAALSAVVAFYQKLTTEFHLPPERIFVIGSSGLTNAVKTRKDLPDAAKEERIKKLREDLAGSVEKIIGKRMEFVEGDDEAQSQLDGVLRPRDRDVAIFIDVGSGGTRGGYLDVAGQAKKLDEGPGIKEVRTLVQTAQKERPGDSFAAVASELTGTQMRGRFKEVLAKDAVPKTRDKVYLVGGIVWVLANYQHPADRGDYVALTAQDIDSFAKAMRAGPTPLAKLAVPPGLPAKDQEKMKKDIQSMREKFNDEELIAGAQLLKALSAEFGFAKKELYFYRHGDYAWVMEYVARKTRKS
jgi:hypothetical protein